MANDDTFKKLELPDFGIENSDKLIEDTLKDFEADEVLMKKIRSLKMSRGEVRSKIPLLIDYKNNIHACLDTDKLDEGGPEFEMDLAREDGEVVIKWKSRKRDYKKARVELGYIIHDFPESWLKEDLKSVKLTKNRKDIIVSFAAMLSSNKLEWKYLSGEFGTGKSFITACFSNSYAKDKNGAVAFINTPEQIDKLRTSSYEKDKTYFSKNMEAYKNVPLLILDSFGNEYKSDFVLSNILHPLLSYRAMHDLATVFVSDFSLAQIEEMYRSKVDAPRAKQLVGLISSKVKKVDELKDTLVL